MKHLFKIALLASCLLCFAACDDDEPRTPEIEVTPAYLNGTWTLAEWNGAPLADGPVSYTHLNETETLSFTHNKLKKIPNIFDAKSKYVMGSVDFSNNQLGATDGKAFDDDFNGINTSELNLSNNRISVFPKQLFSTGSPITTLNLMANMLALSLIHI